MTSPVSWKYVETSKLIFPHRERMKAELIKSIAITDSSLGEEEIEQKLEQGDLTALPNSILQVR